MFYNKFKSFCTHDEIDKTAHGVKENYTIDVN